MFDRLRTWLYWAREDQKARKRGEVRVAPKGTRGRIYERQTNEPSSPTTLTAKGEPLASISARVYRAAEDKWYDLGKISNAEVTKED